MESRVHRVKTREGLVSRRKPLCKDLKVRIQRATFIQKKIREAA